jgi:hypothetical protein
MGKYRYTAHDRFDWVRIDHTFLYARDEERRFPALEVVVEVDKEGEERGLPRSRR